jgi:hypothetical protein
MNVEGRNLDLLQTLPEQGGDIAMTLVRAGGAIVGSQANSPPGLRLTCRSGPGPAGLEGEGCKDGKEGVKAERTARKRARPVRLISDNGTPSSHQEVANACAISALGIPRHRRRL